MISTIRNFFRNIFARPAKCLDCGKYPCKTCNCAYDTAEAAASCAEWDKIIRHDCDHLHHHEDDVSLGISKEEQWLIDHPEITKLYAGKMVAVKADGIVASGSNLDEVRAEFAKKGIQKSLTMFTRIPESEG